MALSGNLRELAPTDLLQMIALQRRSGLLRVDAGGRLEEIDIRQGQIISAHPAQGRLVRLLVALDLLKPAQGERVEMIAEGSGDDLVEVLLRAEGADAEALLPALALHAQAEIDHLLAQSEGSFELETEAPPSRTPIPAGLSLERAIHEGVRRLDEVVDLRETRFPDATVVEAVEGAPPPLPGPTAHVRSLLAAPLAVPVLLAQSGLPPYETLSALEEMVGAGLVRATLEARPPASIEPIRPEGPSVAARIGGMARVAAALALALCVRFALAASVAPASTGGPSPFLTESAHERREMAQLTLALELYRFESGNYPLSLYYLVDRSLMSGPALEDQEGRLYAYEISEGGNAYVLHRSMQGEPRLSYPFVEKN